ncbi:MAG: trypsin-like serine protease [Pseudonocardiaceae bacterium]|nr:trypsin-like serine protease [Pseudonocardiaceae bacterium]
MRLGSVLAGLTAIAVVQAAPAQAIANGDDVPDGAYTFSTSLSMPEITRPDGSTYASACSAALIARQWVISAGHCFHDGAGNRVSGPPRYQVTATVGQATLSGTDGVRVDVTEVVQSEQADVAIGKLAAPVEGIQPLEISTEQPAKGDIVRLVGWGSADSTADLSHRPDRMQTGQFTVARVDAHNVYVTGYRPEPTVSACPYDSGAPFFHEAADGSFQLAATEIGGPDCPHDQEETTARIDVLHDWIREHTEDSS